MIADAIKDARPTAQGTKRTCSPHVKTATLEAVMQMLVQPDERSR
jgi:hypothetical protein